MHIAAAYSIAKTAEEIGIREDYLVPTMDEISVFINTAVAVAEKAMEQGIARKKRTRQDLRETAEFLITSSREKTKLLMEKGHIREPPVVD